MKNIYKTKIIPVKCNKTDYKYLLTLNKLSAEVWNYCVEIDREFHKNNNKYMDVGTMQTTLKGFNNLHSKGINHVYRKYVKARSAMFESIKLKHETSSKAKIPYKKKKFFTSGWDYQSIVVNYDKNIIKLSRGNNNKTEENPRGKRQTPVVCHSKSIPRNIVEIELLYRNGLYLAIKYKEDDINHVIQSDNVASIDLGEIHTITSINTNGNSIIITGRKMRSIKRLRDKEQAKIKSKMTKCVKNSKQYKKYRKALWNVKFKTEKQILDCVHKITKLYLDFCLKNNISKVYYGDLDNCTRDTKKRINKIVGQKLNEWNYGQVMLQLHNKLERYGIELIKVDEYYTSQKCPECGKKNKSKGRNYICRRCGYKQHRDMVGAMNILNDNHGCKVIYYTSKKYLQIA